MTRDYGVIFAQVRALTGAVKAFRQALAPGKLLAAVNQTLVTADYPLGTGDEVAFSPLVTGG